MIKFNVWFRGWGWGWGNDSGLETRIALALISGAYPATSTAFLSGCRANFPAYVDICVITDWWEESELIQNIPRGVLSSFTLIPINKTETYFEYPQWRMCFISSEYKI